MLTKLALIALVVKDYDEAISFYRDKLGFRLVEDTVQSATKRWVVMSPADGSCQILLAKAASEIQSKAIGHQTGGRVFLFLHTDDFETDYKRMIDRGVHFVRPPSQEAYGTVAVFEDLYGNLWDLIQPKTLNT